MTRTRSFGGPYASCYYFIFGWNEPKYAHSKQRMPSARLSIWTVWLVWPAMTWNGPATRLAKLVATWRIRRRWLDLLASQPSLWSVLTGVFDLRCPRCLMTSRVRWLKWRSLASSFCRVVVYGTRSQFAWGNFLLCAFRSLRNVRGWLRKRECRLHWTLRNSFYACQM